MQAAVSKQVETSKDVASSVQSSAFNFSIMISTSVAGLLLGAYSPTSLTYFAIALAIPEMLFPFLLRAHYGD